MIHKIKKDLNLTFNDFRVFNLKNFMDFKLEVKRYFGINSRLIYRLFKLFGFPLKGVMTKFSVYFINLFESYIRKTLLIGDFYKRKLENEFLRYIKVKSYRGFRFRYKLPANGQRTRVNARTSRKLQINNLSNKFSKDIFILKENYAKKILEIEKDNERNIL